MPQDAFGNDITARTNVLDVASHYPYNPERLRLFVDGARAFPEYNSVSQYTHTGDVHELAPAAGETVTLESSERPRYVVQYELATTWAFRANQSLSAGDSIRIGLYDGTDGWYVEHAGDQPDAVADVVMERGGSEVYREPDVSIQRPVTTFARLKLQTGWYDITRQRWERSYTNNGDQENTLIGKFSADGSKGPETGNLPAHFSVTASGTTSGLVLEAGSFAQVNLGTTTPQTRTKTAEFETTISTTGSWVPVHAFRVDPDRQIVNVQLSNTDVVEFSGSGDVRVMPVACSVDNLADGGGNTLADSDFGTPPEHSATNSVIESTDAVAEFPDATGTVGTSASNPGGYQLGFGSWHSTGTGSKRTTQSGSATRKRGLPRDDVCVFLANADTTGDVTVEYITEQDW